MACKPALKFYVSYEIFSPSAIWNFRADTFWFDDQGVWVTVDTIIM